MSQLGEYLARKRIDKGLSYRELEKLSGVSHVTIQDIETGKTKDPGIIKVFKLAKALGISPKGLMLITEGVDPDSVAEDLLMRQEDEVVNALESLVEKLKKRK